MDPRLEEASHAGDSTALHRLLQEDKRLLHKLSAATTPIANNPLHIAALLGHADFVREVLKHSQGLDEDTNVDGLTALHLASAKGHLPVVEVLINTSRGSDLYRIHDRNGLMPVHTAAVKGKVRVLDALLNKSPELLKVRLNDGETVLHCAVKSGCCEALQFLVERLRGNQASVFVNSKDEKGNTILHLAAARRQLQTIKMLLTKTDMNVNEMNDRGLTALDVLLESPIQNDDLTLANMIRSFGGKTSSEVHPQQSVPSNPGLTGSRISSSQNTFENWLSSILQVMQWLGLAPASQLPNSAEEPSNSSETLVIVATLIATIAFQPIMSPPGGFDPTTGNVVRGNDLKKFLVFDMIGLFSSLSIILLLMCVEPKRKRKLVKLLVWVVWVAAFSTALAFTSAAYTVYPNSPGVTVLITIWHLIFGTTVLWVYLHFTIYLFFIVGWWEMNPLDTQMDSKIALLIKRVLVLIMVAGIPVLDHILPGPDTMVDIFFVSDMSSSAPNRYLKIWNIFVYHCWVVTLKLPLVYICLRLTLYLLGIVGCRNEQARMHLVLRIILIVAALSAVGFYVYYLNV